MYLSNKYTKWYFNIIDIAKNRELPAEFYSEKHHIIPKSLGGSNKKENLVKLTAKEHFICHLLLTKMVDGKLKDKMKYAFWMLSVVKPPQQSRYKINSYWYSILKNIKTEIKPMLGKHHSIEARKKISKSNFGKTHSIESKLKISKSLKLKYSNSEMISWNKHKKLTETHKKNISDSLTGVKKGPLTPTHKMHLRDAALARGPASAKTKLKISKKLSGEGNGMFGKTHAVSSKKLMSEKAKKRKKIKCEICNKEITINNFNRWHIH